MFIKSCAIGMIFAISPILSFDALAWSYKNKSNAMDKSKYTIASLRSKNSLNLSFPYGGKNHGNINFIFLELNKYIVTVGIDKGQILCDEPCMTGFRFDDSDTIYLYAQRASDGSSDYIVLERPDLFLDWAKEAKKIKIQLDLYRGGAPVLEFVTKKPLNITGK